MTESEQAHRVVRGAALGLLGGVALGEYLHVKYGIDPTVMRVSLDVVLGGAGAVGGISVDYALGSYQARHDALPPETPTADVDPYRLPS